MTVSRAIRIGRIGRVARAGGGIFTPASLGSSLAAWWKAESASCFTDVGGTVQAGDTDLVYVWKPRSGGANLIQATEANRPRFATNAGAPYVVGVDANTVIQAAAYTGLNAGTFGIYAAVRNIRQVAIDRGMFWTSGNAANKLAGSMSAGVITFHRQANSYGVNVAPTVAANEDVVLAWEMSGQVLAVGAISGFVSKYSEALVAAGVNYGEEGAFALWGGGANEHGLHRIHEVVVTSAPLTGTNRTNLIAYLEAAF